MPWFFSEKNAYEAVLTFRKVNLLQIDPTEEDGPILFLIKGKILLI